MAKNDKPKLKSTKEKSEKTKSSEIQHAKGVLNKAKIEGRKKIPVAQARKALKNLRQTLSQAPKNALELKFTSKELKQIESALGLSLSKLDKKTLAYRIKMIDVDTLDKAESILAGTGARLFTTLAKEGKQEVVKLGYTFQKGDKIRVHFRNNEVAEDNYGMRHLFKKQPEVRQVKISHTSKRGKGREGIATRRGLDGNFYFADGSYAPIFTGTQIEIVKVFTKTELENYKKTSTAYNLGGGRKRYLSKKEATKFSSYYGIAKPKSTSGREAREYWNKLDATDYSQITRPRSKVKASEYIPRNEREKHFISKWSEIMKIKDKQRLIAMKDEIELRPDDPIVHVPGERRGKRLRTGAALRYALFKRHAELCGHNVYITSAYRSAKLQAKLWYRGLARRMRKFRQRYPNKSPREIERLATAENRRFVAPPGRSHHNTGGAIDIHISGLTMHKFNGSRGRYEQAMRTGNPNLVSGRWRKAVSTRLYMDRVLLASHFLGTNYYRETWHWNVDRTNGKDVYRNV